MFSVLNTFYKLLGPHKKTYACAASTLLFATAFQLAVPWLMRQAIDAIESARGAEQGRPRVKLCRWDELLQAAGATA